jgi:phospholipid transport system substrate-binding protein
MLLALVASIALAAAESPTTVVKSGNEQIQKLLASKETTVDKLATKADEFVDFAELAKRALGAEWPKLDKKKQDDFAGTMKGLLRASYAQKAIKDSEANGGTAAQVSYGKETVNGAEAEVPTTLQLKKDKIPVTYRLYKTDKGIWRIYDVVTDENSLLENYRDSFRKVISQKGYDGLLQTLKRRREELEKSNADAKIN